MFADFIDVIFSVALFINACLFIPQIIKILKTKETNGLSLITFGGFNLIQLAALLYGIVHADYVMIAGYTMSLFTCGTVTLLIASGKFNIFKRNKIDMNLNESLRLENVKPF